MEGEEWQRRLSHRERTFGKNSRSAWRVGRQSKLSTLGEGAGKRLALEKWAIEFGERWAKLHFMHGTGYNKAAQTV